MDPEMLAELRNGRPAVPLDERDHLLPPPGVEDPCSGFGPN